MSRGMRTYKAKDFVAFTMDILYRELHKKRCISVAYAAFGIAVSGECTVAAVGRGLAEGRGLTPKAGIKQVDRLLSNKGLKMDDFFRCWVRYLLAERSEIVVALDWTDHAKDGHSTIALNLVTDHGRATPLLWKTVLSKRLKRKRNTYEDDLLLQLREFVPETVRIVVLADRGFGDVALYQLLIDHGMDFVIRFRGDVTMTLPDGRTGPAKSFLSPTGEAERFDNPRLTKERLEVPLVVAVHEKGMKDAWFLASSCSSLDAAANVALYGKRFKIEETFRDIKDAHFGVGMALATIKSPDRRDRLLVAAAITQVFLTLLGKAGESIGLDRKVKANTTTKRTHSLFNQGGLYFAGVCAKWQRELRQTFENLREGFIHERCTYATI